MLIKHRSSLVITISSVIIASVLALTVFGFYTYLEWKEKKSRRDYRLAIYEFDAELFDKYIAVYLVAKIGAEGVFKSRAVIEGTIKNASDKKIYSLKMKIAFCDPEERVVYVDTIYPVGTEFESLINIGDIAKKTKSLLLAGDSVSFTYQLKNCPPKIRDYLKSKLRFAKSESNQPLELVYKIEGLDIR
jgi:hypothetical protein